MIEEEKEMEKISFCIETEVVKRIGALWESGNGDTINVVGVDGVKYVNVKDTDLVFDEIKEGEVLLNSVFDKMKNGDADMVVPCVLLLDSIYHTQIKYSLHFAIKLKRRLFKCDGNGSGSLLRRILDANDAASAAYCVNTIAQLVKDEGKEYAYSFATKFCNRLNSKVFPIFDRHVAWLLNHYIHKVVSDRFAYTQASFGNYERFIEAYQFFKDRILVGEDKDNIDYKTLDVFMWTTGKAINRGADVLFIAPDNDKA